MQMDIDHIRHTFSTNYGGVPFWLTNPDRWRSVVAQPNPRKTKHPKRHQYGGFKVRRPGREELILAKRAWSWHSKPAGVGMHTWLNVVFAEPLNR